MRTELAIVLTTLLCLLPLFALRSSTSETGWRPSRALVVVLGTMALAVAVGVLSFYGHA